MIILIDKLILLVCCILLMYFSYPTITLFCVLGFLTAFSISCLYSYINSSNVNITHENNVNIVNKINGEQLTNLRKSMVSQVLLLVYPGLCLIHPEFCIFLPLILYDMALLGNKIYYIFAFTTLIYPLTSGNGANGGGAPFTFVLVILMVLAFSLACRTKQLLSLQEKFKTMRDSSREYNLLLVHKNRDLMEKQDYEIYLATLKERNRIAREIHDNVGHLLSRSLLQVGALRAVNKDASLTEPLTALKDTLSGAMDSIRSSVHGLHDESIDLQAAIQELLKDFKGYQVDFDYDMSQSVPRNVKYCLISIIKEGLSNISKHSDADRIRLVLREHPSIYQLLLCDNGTGASVSTGGIGLNNMKERVDNLQGSFLAEARTEGFRIFVTIPVQEGDL